MAKDENKRFGVGHIKQHTAGTSNEVSFSVLDARSSLAGAKEGITKEHAFGIRLFTLPGKRNVNATPTKDEGVYLQSGEFVASEPTTSTRQLAALQIESSDDYAKSKGKSGFNANSSMNEEVRSRKRARRIRHVATAVIVIAVVAGLLGVTNHFLHEGMQTHQTQVRSLEVALEDLIKVDATLVAMDELLSNPIDTDSFDKMNEVLANLDSARHLLDEASDIIESIADDMFVSNDKEAAETARSAIAERRIMLEKGSHLMDLSHDAALAISLTSSTWENILNADAIAREAVQLVAENTEEGVRAGQEKTKEAMGLLADAKGWMERAHELYPDLGYDAFIAYIDKRIDALEHAKASNEAILANDPNVAASENETYNELDAEAAALAASLPTDLEDVIHERYVEESAESIEAYQEARAAAAAADSFLRNYLNSGK